MESLRIIFMPAAAYFTSQPLIPSHIALHFGKLFPIPQILKIISNPANFKGRIVFLLRNCADMALTDQSIIFIGWKASSWRGRGQSVNIANIEISNWPFRVCLGPSACCLGFFNVMTAMIIESKSAKESSQRLEYLWDDCSNLLIPHVALVPTNGTG